jgi:hypothetical protein
MGSAWMSVDDYVYGDEAMPSLTNLDIALVSSIGARTLYETPVDRNRYSAPSQWANRNDWALRFRDDAPPLGHLPGQVFAYYGNWFVVSIDQANWLNSP